MILNLLRMSFHFAINIRAIEQIAPSPSGHPPHLQAPLPRTHRSPRFHIDNTSDHPPAYNTRPPEPLPRRSAPKQQMCMIAHQRPGIDHRSGFLRRFACPVQKITDNSLGIGISRKKVRLWNPHPASLHRPAPKILAINLLREFSRTDIRPQVLPQL